MKRTILILGAIISGALFTPCVAQTPYIDFDSLSTGMTSPGAYVLSLAMKDSTINSPLYAGGHFTIAGRIAASNIAEWKDTGYYCYCPYPNAEWVPLGTGTNNDVCALTMWENYLCAGGKFDTAGGIAASHIARWDTAALQWDSLRGKLNGNVYALCVYNNVLYAGGDFTIAGGDTVNRIAAWNDSAWAPVGKGFDTGAVYALTVSNDTLYAGGSFLKSNGVAVNHIAKLTGNTWDSVGSGTNNTVYALADVQFLGGLFVGGAFTRAGGVTNKYIARFEDYINYRWISLSMGLNDTVKALSGGSYPVVLMDKPSVKNFMVNKVVWVGGSFDSAWGFADKYLAMYNPIDSISPLSNGPVLALTSSAYPYVPSNYAGGRFQSALNQDSRKTVSLNNIAILLFVNQPGGIQNLSNHSNVIAYPNPGNGMFNLAFSHPELVSGTQTIEVYNTLGEKIYSRSAQADDYQIDLSTQPNGIYLYRVISESGELIGEGKLVIQR